MALAGDRVEGHVSAWRWQETESEGGVSAWQCWQETESTGHVFEYKVLHGRH